MKIKVKRVRGGSMGDQRDYGLVTGSIWNYEDKPSTNTVSTTMSPTSREDATIEAERGETVVGDLDNDGQLEHAKIGGKRHAQGGTPLNVPDGSFVFSDFRGLLIKNKELLSNVFNYKSGKSATPAKVASRYELNRYKDLLNDPNADFLDQKTAQLMIDNNLKKLGQLALVQESMKGFPDGIPNIALPLFGSDMQAGGSMPQMRRGGLVKAQRGKNIKMQHPAAANPLDYEQDVVYQRSPAYDIYNNTLSLMQNPISAFTYFMDPRAKTQSFGSYIQDPPHNLDIPYQFSKAGLEPSSIGAVMQLFNQKGGGQYMQEGGEEPGFFDRMNLAVPALTGLGAAGVFAAILG